MNTKVFVPSDANEHGLNSCCGGHEEVEKDFMVCFFKVFEGILGFSEFF